MPYGHCLSNFNAASLYAIFKGKRFTPRRRPHRCTRFPVAASRPTTHPLFSHLYSSPLLLSFFCSCHGAQCLPPQHFMRSLPSLTARPPTAVRPPSPIDASISPLLLLRSCPLAAACTEGVTHSTAPRWLMHGSAGGSALPEGMPSRRCWKQGRRRLWAMARKMRHALLSCPTSTSASTSQIVCWDRQ